MVNGRHQEISIKSIPIGASVKIDGHQVGTTPMSIAWRRNDPPRITLELPGYHEDVTQLKRRLSFWLLWDPLIYPWGVLGWPIELFSGAAYTLSPNEITVELVPTNTIASKKEISDIAKTFDMSRSEVIERLSLLQNESSSTELPRRSFPRRNVALAPLEALGLAIGESLTLSESLRATLVSSDYFNIVTRSDMEKVLVEQNFQLTSCSDSKCLVEMGKILAVEKIIGGTLGRVGDTFSVTVRMIDVETGQTEISISRDVKGREDLLLTVIRELGAELCIKYAVIRASSE